VANRFADGPPSSVVIVHQASSDGARSGTEISLTSTSASVPIRSMSASLVASSNENGPRMVWRRCGAAEHGGNGTRYAPRPGLWPTAHPRIMRAGDIIVDPSGTVSRAGHPIDLSPRNSPSSKRSDAPSPQR
jgi:hypothetical protein